MARSNLKMRVAFAIAASFLSLTSANPLLLKRAGEIPDPLPEGWEYEGCYTDAQGARTLNGPYTFSATAMTIESCIAFCQTGGYVYAGTEYSGECYCGNSIANGGTLQPDSECGMTCSGDVVQACGGPNRLTTFKSDAIPPPDPVHNPGVGTWSRLGCYAEGITGRVLTTGMGTPGGGSALTVALCTSACAAGNFKYAGAEYGGECFCGNTIANGGGPAPDGDTYCNMLCNGNNGEYCGGPNRLDLYEDTTIPTSTISSSSSTVPTPTSTVLPTGWTYKGCYVDGLAGRILAHQRPDTPTLTIPSCIGACVSAGYTAAGLEYGVQCFCGNDLRNGGVLAPSETECAMPCAGNAAEICGGSNRMSIYANGELVVYQPPAPQTTGLPGNWEYEGCLFDVQDNRSLMYLITLTENTAETCLSLCSEYGYGAAGMEYGNECWCGDMKTVEEAGAQMMPEADCNMPCAGDPQLICGAGGRITFYTWGGAPLNGWDFPTGAAAGEYRFLIGGVVVPLITTPGINGKVTFLEKYGTGAPNTTGAYEFDPFFDDDFENAWREMHVSSDVFCAAGLTLPDRAGRQLNIGGWANLDTYGVRLYWPDGQPGTPGVNDWHENKNTLLLQAGRWYPTAMMMTNGSILVVGGQVGANGAPVPNLEILPKPVGGYVKHCDWLERTDPYNLYPYLAVLPTGDIFVAYYNEARILDESTLDTARTLPNIPASVDDPNGGRTYPFEGTAVLMPQSPPYTQPLEIMICGGSNPGPEIGIDNCVSIQPEVEEAEWVIERMPSKRVVTCMTALPDGTYLILNGGQQGVAGFATLNQPNRNAVLYDPTKPRHFRMSVMANTTINRLYHSEAVLLDDGRVLVSGSDPQDPRFENLGEEYRVEAFLPPYLLNGSPRPSFVITDRDWAYGDAVTFTVSLPGSTANMKVSLLAAVSSTHGNSMGQRTIFPAFTCTSATSCMVTAPPNVHVAPPAWWQMFVLYNGTPSHAAWVRIGGDPAGLGDWPATGGFSLPGVGPV